MPKINVYLPDDLADAVKDAGLPVSAICQRALEQALRHVTAIRQTAMDGLDDAAPAARLPRFTDRARGVMTRARDAARDEGAASIQTRHMLAGVYAEGQNLALHVLASIEVQAGKVAAGLSRRSEETAGAAVPGGSGAAAPAGSGALRFSGPAAAALELAVTEAIGLGHNYVGCEHLLLGLAAEPDGVAGKTLRGLGADPRTTRRAVVAALAGYVHLRAQTAANAAADPADAARDALAAALRPLAERVARLEARAGLPAA